MKALSRCEPRKYRYRIIQEKDANGDAIYELWYFRPTFWNKNRWIPEKSYGYRHSWTREFKSKEEIFEFLKSHITSRNIVHEGVLADHV